MWPFPSHNAFATELCPAASKCRLPFCIYAHDGLDSLEVAPPSQSVQNGPASSSMPQANQQQTTNPQQTTAQQQTISQQQTTAQPQETNQQEKPPDQTSKRHIFLGLKAPETPVGADIGSKSSNSPELLTESSKPVDGLPKSATRPVSPPLKSVEVEVPLVPRKLPVEPAQYAKRTTLLDHLHKHMSALNDQIARAVDPKVRALCLTKNQLNKLAVDEEERIGREHNSVYENVVKQRIVALKSMTPGGWVKERRTAKGPEQVHTPAKPQPKPRTKTGLTPEEEVKFLSSFVATQEQLKALGIVTDAPTEFELEKCRTTLRLSNNWEECTRCRTRFQVFPERREEDGALTEGTICQYHSGRPFRTPGSNGRVWSCCNDSTGSPGCTTHDTHVFKVEGSRLSLIMPYVKTPENDQAPPNMAVCFDCEMGFTTQGFELLRLTATAWPSHQILVDVLVRPLGHVLDFNTRYSGISHEQFISAKPFDPANPKPNRRDLRIVESPYAARDLLFSHISPNTPLIGHAIDNDLNVMRIIHPTIVDTVLLYPHHLGLPLRKALRVIAKEHLGVTIQAAGAAGHDSYEDAKTTGELVRAKIAEQWPQKKSSGWFIDEDGLHPPMPSGTPPSVAPLAPSMVGSNSAEGMEEPRGEKRKHNQVSEVEEADEPAAKRQA